MHPLEKKITALVQRENLIAPGQSVLLAVSGGPDSMAMLHLLAACRRQLPCTLTVAYCNHKLRPEADLRKEEQLVAEQAAALGLQVHFGKVAVRDHAHQHKLSIEEAARDLRYAFLLKLAENCGATSIAVAHTADDQVEEVLLRLIRGTGSKGLSGMQILRNDKGVIRPLLLTEKRELLAYLGDKKIPFALDHSNRDRRFLRNRIRHHLLPLLEKEYNPNIREVLRNTASILEKEEEFVAPLAEAAYQECVTGNGPQKYLAAKRLNRQHPALQRRVVEKTLWSLAVYPTFSAIERIRNLSQNPNIAKELHLAHGLRVMRTKDTLRFEFPKGRTAWRGSASKADPAERGQWRYRIDRPGSLDIEEIGRIVRLSETGPLSADILLQQKDECLDFDTISFPLICRSQRPGDRFRPLGAPGSKKVADYLRDKKIARQERHRIPVLEADGKIVALPGLAIAHDFRVRRTTRRLLRISLL